MSMIKWAKSRISRNRRSRSAISTIMANLTMLVIVVVLSSLLFVWAISSFGIYQGGAAYWFSSKSLANQERISVESVCFVTVGSSHFAKIYVRNVGPIPFTIGGVYVNSTLQPAFSPTLTINVTQVCLLVSGCSAGASNGFLVSGAAPVPGDIQTIKVATLRGTVSTTTWVA